MIIFPVPDMYSLVQWSFCVGTIYTSTPEDRNQCLAKHFNKSSHSKNLGKSVLVINLTGPHP